MRKNTSYLVLTPRHTRRPKSKCLAKNLGLINKMKPRASVSICPPNEYIKGQRKSNTTSDSGSTQRNEAQKIATTAENIKTIFLLTYISFKDND